MWELQSKIVPHRENWIDFSLFHYFLFWETNPSAECTLKLTSLLKVQFDMEFFWKVQYDELLGIHKKPINSRLWPRGIVPQVPQVIQIPRVLGIEFRRHDHFQKQHVASKWKRATGIQVNIHDSVIIDISWPHRSQDIFQVLTLKKKNLNFNWKMCHYQMSTNWFH